MNSTSTITRWVLLCRAENEYQIILDFGNRNLLHEDQEDKKENNF